MKAQRSSLGDLESSSGRLCRSEHPQEMRQVSRLLVLLFLISLTSSAQSASAVQTTSKGQPTAFHLPNNGTFVLGFRTKHSWPHIQYTVSYLGKELLKGNLDSFQWPSQWTPLLMSREVISGANLEDSPIPADPQELVKRHLSLLSKAEVQWQMMTLPLKDHELQMATPGEEVFLDLPEEDDVWVAVWNKRGREFRTDLTLFHEQERLRFLTINASKDWSVICINDERIIYGNDVHPLSNKDLKGRRLQMKSYDKVHLQVFPVPLKSTDAAPPTATLLIAIAVVTTTVVILGTFLGCRFFWKKRKAGTTEGATVTMSTINNPSSADGGRVPTGEHFGASSFHVSENMLYGVVIRR